MNLKNNIENKEKEVKDEGVKTIKTPKKIIKSEVETSTNELSKDLDQLISEWKAKYGKVFKNDIDDNEFVIWRPIKRKEYKELLLADEEIELLAKQEAICKIAILYPSNPDELIDSKAGLATVLGEEILRYSGFDISATQSL